MKGVPGLKMTDGLKTEGDGFSGRAAGSQVRFLLKSNNEQSAPSRGQRGEGFKAAGEKLNQAKV